MAIEWLKKSQTSALLSFVSKNERLKELSYFILQPNGVLYAQDGYCSMFIQTNWKVAEENIVIDPDCVKHLPEWKVWEENVICSKTIPFPKMWKLQSEMNFTKDLTNLSKYIKIKDIVSDFNLKLGIELEQSISVDKISKICDAIKKFDKNEQALYFWQENSFQPIFATTDTISDYLSFLVMPMKIKSTDKDYRPTWILEV